MDRTDLNGLFYADYDFQKRRGCLTVACSTRNVKKNSQNFPAFLLKRKLIKIKGKKLPVRQFISCIP